MRISRFCGYILVFVMVFIGSCAKVGTPSGGPRDVDPPVVLKSVPDNGTTNFKGNKFIVTFDEYVTINGVNDKLMVSPPLGKRPTVSMKGKSITVEFEDILRDSTTYTFYFQDAIKDLNEGNPLENYQFVFSTGDVIDSLSLKGNIYYGMSLDPPAEALVMLYSNLSDTSFKTLLPDYITKASKEGNFRIDNIRAGKYRLFGLEDQDNSKNFNLNDEVIAFYPSVIDITPEKNYFMVKEVLNDTASLEEQRGATGMAATEMGVAPSDTVAGTANEIEQADTSDNEEGYRLFLFQPAKTQRYLTSSSRNSASELRYTLSLPPGPYSFDFRIAESAENDFVVERSVNGDTLTVWLLDSAYFNQPSLKTIINYPFSDPAGNIVQREDTITLRYAAPRQVGRARETAEEPTTRVYGVSANFSTGKISPLMELRLTASTPFSGIDGDLVHLYEIEDSTQTEVKFNISRDSSNLRILRIDASLLRDKEYLFVADSAAFRNLYGLVSDSLGVKFSLNDNDKYGKLIMRISGYEGSRVIQLLSADESKTLREYFPESDGTLEIPYLDRGKYKLRVIYDVNGDGKWTTGDYETQRQPENVSYFPEEIDVKVNWEQIYDWDISVQNAKKNRNINK
ncbi:MAG: Ig-like domain-containing domain [Bacteroidales bacterium]|jgi:hypothetical protein